jgi:hypothetical protein
VVEKGVQERDLAVLLDLTGKLNIRVNGVEMSSESLYLSFSIAFILRDISTKWTQGAKKIMNKG